MDEITEKSDEINDVLVDALVNARKSKGISRTALAEACDIPSSTLADYEMKRRIFPMNKAIRVAMYLELDIFNPLKTVKQENEEVQLVLSPDNIQDFFSLLLKNDAELKSEVSSIKELLQKLLEQTKKED